MPEETKDCHKCNKQTNQVIRFIHHSGRIYDYCKGCYNEYQQEQSAKKDKS